MLTPHRFLSSFVAIGFLAAPSLASAQTVTLPHGVYPTRSQPSRPQNLKPQGVNYEDCAQDMTLDFPLIVSGFSGQNLSVWASLGPDCTAPADRGVGGVSGQTCWRLDGGFVAQSYQGSTPISVVVRVQDALAHMDGAVPFAAAATHGDIGSCSQQASPAGTQILINFVPLQSDDVTPVGTAYQYVLPVDVLGPPAPVGLARTAGDSFIDLTWTPNTDADTAGYDVFLDPTPGKGEANLVGGSPTVADPSTGEYRITGLEDGTPHTVVVAAIDGFGNVGSPSSQVSATPEPSQGSGGGGGCAIGSAGERATSFAGVLACAVAAAAVARRRMSQRTPR